MRRDKIASLYNTRYIFAETLKSLNDLNWTCASWCSKQEILLIQKQERSQNIVEGIYTAKNTFVIYITKTGKDAKGQSLIDQRAEELKCPKTPNSIQICFVSSNLDSVLFFSILQVLNGIISTCMTFQLDFENI